MVEEKTIYTFDQPLTRYQFSDINLTIVSGYPPMSEDEPTPEPTPTPPEPVDYSFVSPMTSYGLNDQEKTTVNEMTLKTGSSNSTFWIKTDSYLRGGRIEDVHSRTCSNDNWQFNDTQLKTIMFNNIKWEIQYMYFEGSESIFLPIFSTNPDYTQQQHTLTMLTTLTYTWGTDNTWPSNTQIRPIYDKTTDTLYGTTQIHQPDLETLLLGHELIYLTSHTDTNMNSLHFGLDNNTSTNSISISYDSDLNNAYNYKLEHASQYITDIQNLLL